MQIRRADAEETSAALSRAASLGPRGHDWVRNPDVPPHADNWSLRCVSCDAVWHG